VKRRRKVIIGIITSVVVVGAGVAWYALKGSGSEDEGAVVRIENPQKGELVELVNAPGEIEPLTRVAISARVMARIIDMPYEEGARVTKGDPNADPPVPPSVLVRLDATDLEAALRSAEARRAAQAAQIEAERARIAGQRAQLGGTKASLTKAGIDLKRTSDLLASKDVSQSDLDQAQSRYDELSAQYASAEHGIEAAEINLQVLQHNLDAADAEIARARDAVSYTTITSPIDGVVTRRNAKVGELVVTGTMNNPGTMILEVADLSQMLIVVQVNESDIGDVRTGQKAAVRIHAYPDDKFSGTVDSIALTNDFDRAGAKYYKTKILLDKNDTRIYSGLTADVDILTNSHPDVIKVPSQAILGRPVDDLPLAIRDKNPNVDMKKTFATVVYRFVDGKSAVTPVTVGPSDETHTIVTAGLTAEDKIVVGPYKILDSLAHDKKLQDEREVEKKKKEAEAKKAADGKKAETAGSTDSSAK
jgi:HlyD family secretion protein